MLGNYTELIDKIKEEVIYFNYGETKTEEELFIMGEDFMRFKFITSDKLPYNQKN